jgi:3-oxoadipate enol-lactonase
MDPLVLIPGIQGRWEWMAPAIVELARRSRVLTFSLNEVTDDHVFDRWIETIDRLIDATGHPRATIVGVSFGGLIATRYAARRPGRTSALVLVSTPSPRWQLDAKQQNYIKRPLMTLPLFAARATSRFVPELLAGRTGWWSRLQFAAEHAGRAVRYPGSPPRMAAWVREWMANDFVEDCRTITAPTLLITGDRGLDRVVPPESTMDYLALIPQARHVVLPNTGHLGLVMKPREFAALVHAFLERGSPGAEPNVASLAQAQLSEGRAG